MLMLNGNPASERELALLAQALSTTAIVAEKGGYLFKCRQDGQTFHFGILPNFLNGQRSYHYNIDIGPNAFTLMGSLNTNGTLTALFKLDPAKIGPLLPEEDRQEYRRQYAELARFLLTCGLPESLPLDSISTEFLREAQLGEELTFTLSHLATWCFPPQDTQPETP